MNLFILHYRNPGTGARLSSDRGGSSTVPWGIDTSRVLSWSGDSMEHWCARSNMSGILGVMIYLENPWPAS